MVPTMSATYKEYGWEGCGETCAHSYLFPVLCKVLGRVNGPILDVGCGNGWIANALLGKGYDVWGVDASEAGIALADRQAPGRFFVLDVLAGELPPKLADKPFRTIISTEVIEHLYDPRRFLSFARRILVRNGGGRLILSTPYHGYLKYLALAVSGKMDKHLTVLWDGGHVKFFSRATLGQMLHEQGFEITRFLGAGRLPWLWKSMVVSASPATTSAHPQNRDPRNEPVISRVKNY